MTIKKEAVVLLAPAARYSTPPAITVTNESNGVTIKDIKGAKQGQLTNFHLIVDVTSITSSQSIQVAIEGLDPASGKYYELIDIAALEVVGTTIYRLGRDILYDVNSEQDAIPYAMRLSFTHANASIVNYSVGMNYEVDLNN